jgi:hypothetical protein
MSNDNGAGVVIFDTSENLVVKSTMFPHRDIDKYTWASREGKMYSQVDQVLMGRRRNSSVLAARSSREADCDTDHCLVVAKVRRDWQ